MALDIRTIIVLLIVASGVMTLLMIAGGYRSRGEGFWKWVIGLALTCAGWLLIATRGVLPPVISVVLADTLLFAGPCFHVTALMEYGGRRVSPAAILAPGIVLFAATYAVSDNYAWISAVTGVGYVAVMWGAAAVALRLGGKKGGRMRLVIAGLYFAGSVPVMARAAGIFMEQSHAGIFAPNLMYSIAFVTLFAVTVGGSFSFLLMSRERAEEATRHLAMYDALTELANRRALTESAERELARARREGRPLGVLMLDIDHFKRVNDRHGHQTGDEVLREFAARASGCLRGMDLLGRWGGEEFCAILPGARAAAAAAAAERIRAAIAAAPMAGGLVPVTVTIGVAVSRPADDGLDELLGRADAALYEGKAAGRNRVVAAVDLPQGPAALAA